MPQFTLLPATAQPAAGPIPDASPARRWRSVEQIAHAHPAFTVPALRMLIQRSKPHYDSRGEWVEGNGLASAICQPGGKHGRILIDEMGFARWLEHWVTSEANYRNTSEAA